MRIIAVAGAVIVGIVLIYQGMFHSSVDAMAQCQQTHSYDTCFQILNR